MSTRFDLGAALRRDGVDGAEDEDGVGGDHARREVRTSWEVGSAMVRVISRVVRQRICRRVPERLAVWVADWEGRTGDVAGVVSFKFSFSFWMGEWVGFTFELG